MQVLTLLSRALLTLCTCRNLFPIMQNRKAMNQLSHMCVVRSRQWYITVLFKVKTTAYNMDEVNLCRFGQVLRVWVYLDEASGFL